MALSFDGYRARKAFRRARLLTKRQPGVSLDIAPDA